MNKSRFEIQQLTENSQLQAFVGKEGTEWLISVYFFSKTWSVSARKKWQRRLRSTLEDVLTSYHARTGSQHPATHEVLALHWVRELDFDAPGTLVIFMDKQKMSWLLQPKLSIQQTVLARTFHIKPLLTLDDRDNPFPEELVRSFARLKARGLATDHLPTAARWISQGHVTTLFASAKRQVWGEVDQSAGEIRVLPRSHGRGADDILDDLVEKAWSQGASCWVIEDDQLPSHSPIVAFRGTKNVA